MPSEEDLFVNDDLNNSIENRLNHVLFGLFLNDQYRREILRRLCAEQDAVIYKPIDRSWGRPDFALESYDGKILGYVEVELDKDPEQLARYRANAGVPVYSIGREKEDHSITLSQLVEIGEDVLEEDPAPQFNLMVKHLAKQVSESARVRKSAPPGPVQSQLQTLLGTTLLKAGMVNWGDERPQPGKFFGRTNGPEGISVRVFSPKSSDKTVGVFHITGGRPEVEFASYDHLSKYLPDKWSELDKWADFIEQRLDGNIRNGVQQSRRVKLSSVDDILDDLVKVMLLLR